MRHLFSILLFLLLAAASDEHDLEKQKGNANRATLAVARKLVAYLVMAVDRGQSHFLVQDRETYAAA